MIDGDAYRTFGIDIPWVDGNYNAFGSKALTIGSVTKLFAGIRQILKDGGQFIFDTFNTKPSAIAVFKQYDIKGLVLWGNHNLRGQYCSPLADL